MASAIPQPDLSLVTEERLLQAVHAAREAVAESPQSSRAWGTLGNVFLIHGWEAEAASCYRRAIEIEPGQFRWHYLHGRSLEDADPAAAAEALAEALTLDAAYVPAHHARARVLRDLGRDAEAKAHLAAALELDPNDALALLGLGELALQSRDFESADEYLDRALALDPTLTEAHRALAQVKLAQGHIEEAERHAEAGREQGQERFPPDELWEEVERAGVTKFWISKRADRYLREKQYEQAVVQFWRIAEDSERNPMFWYNFGNALSNTGRHGKAVEMYTRAIAALEDPLYSETIDQARREKIYNNLCIAHASNGDNRASERCFRKAGTLFPSSEFIVLNLVTLLHRQKRLSEAIQVLEDNPLTPASPSLQQTLERITQELRAALTAE